MNQQGTGQVATAQNTAAIIVIISYGNIKGKNK